MKVPIVAHIAPGLAHHEEAYSQPDTKPTPSMLRTLSALSRRHRGWWAGRSGYTAQLYSAGRLSAAHQAEAAKVTLAFGLAEANV